MLMLQVNTTFVAFEYATFSSFSEIRSTKKLWYNKDLIFPEVHVISDLYFDILHAVWL